MTRPPGLAADVIGIVVGSGAYPTHAEALGTALSIATRDMPCWVRQCKLHRDWVVWRIRPLVSRPL